MRYLEYRARGRWLRESFPISGNPEKYAEARATDLLTKTRVVEVTEKVIYTSQDHGKQANPGIS